MCWKFFFKKKIPEVIIHCKFPHKPETMELIPSKALIYERCMIGGARNGIRDYDKQYCAKQNEPEHD